MKHWMIVTVETEIDWPTQETSVEFSGQALFLRPPNGDSAPDVRLQYEHPEHELETFETICRFLSAMSWWNRRPARACTRIHCNAPIRGVRDTLDPPEWEQFHLDDGMKLSADPKARLALALYREAISVKNTPYEFLGYFKVINIVFGKAKDQANWINAKLPQLTNGKAKERVAMLSSLHSDVGKYLYESGRCAVAHAFNSTVVDPDDPTDVFRLSADMPIARELAEHLIVDHFKIRRR